MEIENMIAKLTPNLYLSGANEVLDYTRLKELGIDAILNVSHNENDPAYSDILSIKIGLNEFTHNPDFFVSMAVLALENLITNGRTVLIHCYAGAHRSPYIAFRYLAEKEHRTLDAVYKEFIPTIPWGIVYPHSLK